jgi:hypothetical protein
MGEGVYTNIQHTTCIYDAVSASTAHRHNDIEYEGNIAFREFRIHDYLRVCGIWRWAGMAWLLGTTGSSWNGLFFLLLGYDMRFFDLLVK